MFCPQCKSEFREGIYTCVDCEIALVHELPSDERPENDLPAGEAVVFRSARTFEAEMIGGALEAAGIPYSLYAEMAGGFRQAIIEQHWAPGQYRVISVPAMAEAQAREVIDSLVPPDLSLVPPLEEDEPEDTGRRQTFSRIVSLSVLIPILGVFLLSALFFLTQCF